MRVSTRLDTTPIEFHRPKKLPTDSRNPSAAPVADALTKGEQAFLDICNHATSLSKHFGMIEHQTSGQSVHFPDTWRNLFGNPKETAINAMLHSWRRWKTHTLRSPSQWGSLTKEEALFKPKPGALAHYAGERSLGGATAARGAMTGLWRFSITLGPSFPFEESGVNGWTNRLRDHIVQPKIPFEVA